MIKWILITQCDEYRVYRIVKNDIYLTWKDVLDDMIVQDDNFVTSFIQILEKNPFTEYYIEFVPTSLSNYNNTIFEFVLIKTTGFGKKADIKSFGADRLDTNSNQITIFPNPSNTALLICPCYNHKNNPSTYIHIGNFINSSNTNQEQKVLLFDKTFSAFGEQLKKINSEKSLWLSTHGKGVSWLHIRIDLIPRYISWNKYKL
jgi:hypothetical protein